MWTVLACYNLFVIIRLCRKLLKVLIWLCYVYMWTYSGNHNILSWIQNTCFLMWLKSSAGIVWESFQSYFVLLECYISLCQEITQSMQEPLIHIYYNMNSPPSLNDTYYIIDVFKVKWHIWWGAIFYWVGNAKKSLHRKSKKYCV